MTPNDRDGRPALKHEDIAATLGAQIRAGKMPRQLPGETTLAAHFGVSRTTIRHALEELGRDGLIATRPGRGSFVTYDGSSLAVERGWATAFRLQGIETTVEVRRIELIEDVALAHWLAESSASFVAVERVRRIADGTAISFEHSRIPATDALRSLPETGLVEGSLTATLASAGLFADHGQEWVEARPLNEEEAATLGRGEHEVFLATRRVTRNALGELVEYVESVLDPAHFQLQMAFK